MSTKNQSTISLKLLAVTNMGDKSTIYYLNGDTDYYYLVILPANYLLTKYAHYVFRQKTSFVLYTVLTTK